MLSLATGLKPLLSQEEQICQVPCKTKEQEPLSSEVVDLPGRRQWECNFYQ